MSDQPETIRAFIAVELSAEMREQVGDLMERLEKGIHFTRSQPRWSRPDGLHLTVRFLGRISPDQVKKIGGAMYQAGAETAPFDVSARGLGVFPHEDSPRVLWVGVKRGADELISIYRRLNWRLGKLGFEPEARPYQPHLTLARFQSGAGAREMMTVVASHRRAYCGDCRVSRIGLFQSELLPDGARYTELASAEFTFEPSVDQESASDLADEPDSTSK